MGQGGRRSPSSDAESHIRRSEALPILRRLAPLDLRLASASALKANGIRPD